MMKRSSDFFSTLSREEREAIVAELGAEEIAPASESPELPVEVPSFSIDEAPPVPRSGTLAQLVGDLAAAVEKRVRNRLDLELMSAEFLPDPHSRLHHSLVVAEAAAERP